MKNWDATYAKRNFSQILDELAQEPQVVYRRGKPVSVVRGYEIFRESVSGIGRKSTRQWLEELRQINQEEENFIPPVRTDRDQTDWNEDNDLSG